MVVYSLGMTLYWCVDYLLPQNQVRSTFPLSLACTLLYTPDFKAWSTVLSPVSCQPVQLSAELEGLLLSMCEDVVLRRTDLLTVLEACELHHKAAMLPPAERLIRQLVEDVYRNSVSVWFITEDFESLLFIFSSIGSSLLDSLSRSPSHCFCRLIICPWQKMDPSSQTVVKWSGTDYTVRIQHNKDAL